jgi:hypothetical protein
VSEPTLEAPEEPKRSALARAFIASVRQSGENRSPSSYLVTAGLAVVLAGAVALGVGAVVFHRSPSPKTVSAADRQRSTISGTPATPRVTVPVPVRPGVNAPQVPPAAPGAPGAPGKDGKTPTGKKQDSKRGSSGSSGNGIRAASIPTQLIVSYASNRCIDVTDGNSSSGTPVQIWDCNSSAPQQRWAFVNGTMRSLGMCMTAAGSSDGAPIKMARCNGSASQRFTLNSAHDIAYGSVECLDVKDQNTDNGARLQLWSCAGSANQKWYTS